MDRHYKKTIKNNNVNTKKLLKPYLKLKFKQKM